MSPPPSASPLPADPSATTGQAAPVRALQVWLALLSAIAALACVRVLLLPPWPHAQPLRPERIQPLLIRAGLDPQPLPSRPLPRSAGLGLSPLLVWMLPQVGELSLASVHVRRRDDVQVAWITRDIRSLALKQRRLDAPEPGVASGTIQAHPAFQTCLVPHGASQARPAVTLLALQDAVDRQPLTRRDRLQSLLGLRRHRELRCLLVTLRSRSAAPLPVGIWSRLLASLQTSDLASAPPSPPVR